MRRLLASAAIVVGALYFGLSSRPTPRCCHSAHRCAASVCEALPTLEAQATANPLTEQFALLITGENSASDTIGGRTGISAPSRSIW
jgi:hypothetical protein